MGAHVKTGRTGRLADSPSAIGEHVRLLRVVANLSRREAAPRAGVSPWRLAAIERGTVRVRPDDLERILRALGSSLNSSRLVDDILDAVPADALKGGTAKPTTRGRRRGIR